MSGQFGIVFAPWDYQRSPERFEQLVGAAPLDHVTIPLITGPIESLSLDDGAANAMFRSAGGWHYPTPRRRSGSALRIPLAHWFGKRNPLAPLREAASSFGLRVRFELDLRHAGGLCDQNAHLRRRNAWDDEDPQAGACPTHPELRELLETTLDELMEFQPDALYVADWSWAPPRIPDTSNADSTRPLAWHATARRLCDLCFCAACRSVAERDEPFQAAAGAVGCDGVIRSVQTWIRRLIAGEVDASQVAGDAILSAYIAACERDCRAWFARLPKRTEAPTLWQVLDAPAPTDPIESPTLVRHLHPPLEDEVREVAAQGSTAGAPIGLRLNAGPPSHTHGDDLVKRVKALHSTGVDLLEFAGVAEAHADVVEWLRKATRYSHRE